MVRFSRQLEGLVIKRTEPSLRIRIPTSATMFHNDFVPPKMSQAKWLNQRPPALSLATCSGYSLLWFKRD